MFLNVFIFVLSNYPGEEIFKMLNEINTNRLIIAYAKSYLNILTSNSECTAFIFSYVGD